MLWPSRLQGPCHRVQITIDHPVHPCCTPCGRNYKLMIANISSSRGSMYAQNTQINSVPIFPDGILTNSVTHSQLTEATEKIAFHKMALGYCKRTKIVTHSCPNHKDGHWSLMPNCGVHQLPLGQQAHHVGSLYVEVSECGDHRKAFPLGNDRLCPSHTLDSLNNRTTLMQCPVPDGSTALGNTKVSWLPAGQSSG